MQTYLDCYPCFLRQTLSAARFSGADETQEFEVLQQALDLLKTIGRGTKPPEIAYKIHKMVRDVTGNKDPYLSAKKQSTLDALSLYPDLKALVEKKDLPEQTTIDTALKIAIAGNIIDFGIKDTHDDLWQTVIRVLNQPYAIDDSQKLKDQISHCDYILYLADNAGETVFDRILIEALGKPVVYAVKGGPVLNDAVYEDATEAGLDSCSTIIDTGSDAPGTILQLTSDAFREEFKKAPVIIAKGQANYETLSTSNPKVFCLLQVKCPVIGVDTGTPTGSIVLKQSLSDSSERLVAT
jgi:hypothetical protein